MAEVLSLSVGTARNLRHGEHVLPNGFGLGKNLHHFLQIPTWVTRSVTKTTSGERQA